MVNLSLKHRCVYLYCEWVGDLTPHGLSGCVPPELVFTPHFLTIVPRVDASGPPHNIRLWVSKGKGVARAYSL